MVFGMIFTHNEIIDNKSDINSIGGATTCYAITAEIYEISDQNLMLVSLFPSEL